MPASPAQVSVIDDDERICRAITRLLQVAGFSSRAYPSAEAFLNDPERCQSILVICDIHLRGMSGLDLQKRLRSEDPPLPLALITAHDGAEVRAEARASGCIAFFRKPFLSSELLKLIRSVAGSRTHDG